MRGLRVVGAAAAVLVTTAGCGFASALADPQAAQSDAPPTVVVPTTTAPPPGPVTLAAVDLSTARLGSDHLTVVRGVTQTNLVPGIVGWRDDCGVDSAGLQYVAVTIGFGGSDVAGHLTVEPGPDTPADIAPLGVFFDGADQPYCQDDPPFQPTDTFWWHGGPDGDVTAYIVLRDAVTPATPEGRAEVFSTLSIRIDALRVHGAGDQPFQLATPSIGALCADDPDALCVPLT